MRIYTKDHLEKSIERVTESGCWIWLGALRNGYGVLKPEGIRKSKVKYAHRVAYELYNGLLPEGSVLCHVCDEKTCVNPTHVFVGTHQANHDDMVKKGRDVKGSKCKGAKINEQMAREIKRNAHLGSRDLGAMFGISRQAVADILYGRTWRHA